MSDNLLSVEDMSEIPTTTKSTGSVPSGSGGSKGANLFLARQKLIADMMEQEEAEREAEERHREDWKEAGEEHIGGTESKDWNCSLHVTVVVKVDV